MVLSYVSLSILFILIFNSYFVKDVIKENNISSLTLLFRSVLLIRGKNSYLMGVCFFLFIIYMVIINKKYLKLFLKNYKSELDLMTKLNSDNQLKKLPLIVTNIMFHLISIVFSWIVIYLLYKNIFKFFITKYSGYSLINFNIFRGSLLVFLLFPGMIVSILLSYIIFWKEYY